MPIAIKRPHCRCTAPTAPLFGGPHRSLERRTLCRASKPGTPQFANVKILRRHGGPMQAICFLARVLQLRQKLGLSSSAQSIILRSSRSWCTANSRFDRNPFNPLV